MRICIIGSGYVGLVTGACFAELGNTVTCVDSDSLKLAQLAKGAITIYEPGLEALVKRNLAAGRLSFSGNLASAARGARVFFIAVGTPPDADGSADTRQVLQVAVELGRLVSGRAVVIVKSTVPVGTTDEVARVIQEEIRRRGSNAIVDVAFNPEFLKEGDAVNDFMAPDRVVIGSRSERTLALLRTLYLPLVVSPEKILAMGVRDAELAKYAANAMLAARISFMNEIAGLCDRVGADIERVRRAIGSDPRIGPAFLNSGCGYGGSCLPKDIGALIHTASSAGYDPVVLKAVETRNRLQKRVLPEMICKRFGAALSGLRFALWGLAFKPGTDDMREASSIVLLSELLGAGAAVSAYDPAALESARRALPKAWLQSGQLHLASHQYDAVTGADALILMTEWEPFRKPDFVALRRAMRGFVVFDGRNQYDPALLRNEGFEYFGVGRGTRAHPASTSDATAAARNGSGRG